MSKTCKQVIDKLEPHFPRYVLPYGLTLDNWPHFKRLTVLSFRSLQRNSSLTMLKHRVPIHSSMERLRTALNQQVHLHENCWHGLIHICLWWILGLRHQKEWTVPQHITSALSKNSLLTIDGKKGKKTMQPFFYIGNSGDSSWMPKKPSHRIVKEVWFHNSGCMWTNMKQTARNVQLSESAIFSHHCNDPLYKRNKISKRVKEGYNVLQSDVHVLLLS